MCYTLIQEWPSSSKFEQQNTCHVHSFFFLISIAIIKFYLNFCISQLASQYPFLFLSKSFFIQQLARSFKNAGIVMLLTCVKLSNNWPVHLGSNLKELSWLKRAFEAILDSCVFFKCVLHMLFPLPRIHYSQTSLSRDNCSLNFKTEPIHHFMYITHIICHNI